jgi:indolepyruvate ferredoxin oxidoreductase alpha subunit
MKSQVWLLDPRPNLPAIVRAVEHGFELSEASHTPVMLELRIRACHVHGSFVRLGQRPPGVHAARTPSSIRARDVNRIVLPPASYLHEQEKISSAGPPRCASSASTA